MTTSCQTAISPEKASIAKEMDSRTYSIVLAHEGETREEVHGDRVTFQSHGIQRKANLSELPAAIVVGGRTLGDYNKI